MVDEDILPAPTYSATQFVRLHKLDQTHVKPEGGVVMCSTPSPTVLRAFTAANYALWLGWKRCKRTWVALTPFPLLVVTCAVRLRSRLPLALWNPAHFNRFSPHPLSVTYSTG